MDLPLSDFRSMAVEEFDTTKFLTHAAQQAQERGYKNFPIVDVNSHHYESGVDRRNPRLHGRSGAATACAQRAHDRRQNRRNAARRRRLSGHGRARDALCAALPGKDGSRRAARRVADAARSTPSASTSPGRFRRRCCGLACIPRSTSKWRSRAPITAGSASACWRTSRASARCSICRSTTPTLRQYSRGIRPHQGRRRLHGDLGALSADPSQFLHEPTPCWKRSACRSLSMPAILGRPERRHAEPLHFGARPRLRLLQHGASGELDHQRLVRTLSQAEGDVGRERARLAAFMISASTTNT